MTKVEKAYFLKMYDKYFEEGYCKEILWLHSNSIYEALLLDRIKEKAREKAKNAVQGLTKGKKAHFRQAYRKQQMIYRLNIKKYGDIINLDDLPF